MLRDIGLFLRAPAVASRTHPTRSNHPRGVRGSVPRAVLRSVPSRASHRHDRYRWFPCCRATISVPGESCRDHPVSLPVHPLDRTDRLQTVLPHCDTQASRRHRLSRRTVRDAGLPARDEPGTVVLRDLGRESIPGEPGVTPRKGGGATIIVPGKGPDGDEPGTTVLNRDYPPDVAVDEKKIPISRQVRYRMLELGPGPRPNVLFRDPGVRGAVHVRQGSMHR